MRRRLRLVHVCEKNLLSTGSAVQMLDAATAAAAVGNQVSIITRPGGELATAARDAGVQVRELPLRGASDLLSAVEIRRHLRATRAEIVHVHKGRGHGLVLLAATGLGALPRLVVNRGVSFPLDRWNSWKYRHSRVGAVVCVAEAVRQVVIATAGVSPDKAVTVYGGTDVARFDPAQVDHRVVRDELGLAAGALLIGQVSLRPGKGAPALIRAFAEAMSGLPSAFLLLIGCEAGQRQRKVVALARELGIGDQLLTVPFRRDMPEVLAACDIVVDASWQGTGITGVLREAMSLKKAVIATRIAGNPELVTDDESGVLVPPRHHAALVAALQRLGTDTMLRRRLGEAARDRVVACFDLRRRTSQLERIYRRLAGSSHLS